MGSFLKPIRSLRSATTESLGNQQPPRGCPLRFVRHAFQEIRLTNSLSFDPSPVTNRELYVCLLSSMFFSHLGSEPLFSVSRWTEHNKNSPVTNSIICVFELYSNFCLFFPFFQDFLDQADLSHHLFQCKALGHLLKILLKEKIIVFKSR